MPKRHLDKLERYLAYAFASADVLFDIDKDGRIAELLGAVKALAGEDAQKLIGRPWTALLATEDRDLALALLLGLRPGERRGPIRVQLATAEHHAPPRYVALTLFRNAGADGCVAGTLSTNASLDLPRPTAPGQLLGSDVFSGDLPALLTQAQAGGTALNFDLVATPGLAEALQSVPDGARRQLQAAVATCLKASSLRGASAVQLDEERFALLSDCADDLLCTRLMDVIAGFGLDVPVSRSSSSIPATVHPEEAARAIKVAMETFIQRGPEAATCSLAEAVKATVQRATTLRVSISTRRFKLLYQPIVDLQSRQVHHYEALLRLDDRSSPFDAVRLAEELDLVREFDEAIAESVIDDLASHPDRDLRIAVNVSAVSLLSERYVPALLARLSSRRVAARQLLVELTETTPIADYALARARIDQLRASGIGFCLDDVGAGSAAFDHLRLLNFDFMKLDGRFAGELAQSVRAQTVVRHLAQLGHELGGVTIAEHVESEAVSQIYARAGVQLGQGWLFGKADALPQFQAQPQPARMARRVGARDAWC